MTVTTDSAGTGIVSLEHLEYHSKSQEDKIKG